MTGCSNIKHVPVIEYATIHKCPRPQKSFALIPYEDDYLDSPVNAEIALKNRIIINEYIKVWIDAVLCYERQVLLVGSE